MIIQRKLYSDVYKKSKKQQNEEYMMALEDNDKKINKRNERLTFIPMGIGVTSSLVHGIRTGTLNVAPQLIGTVATGSLLGGRALYRKINKSEEKEKAAREEKLKKFKKMSQDEREYYLEKEKHK